MDSNPSRPQPPNSLPETDEPTDRPDRSKQGPLAPLLHPQFRLLWAISLLAGSAFQMQTVVNAWLVYSLTGSALQLGILGAFRIAPLVLFSLVGGSLADTWDRRRLLVFTQGLRGVMAIALALLAVTGSIEVWHIYASTFLGGAASLIDGPTRQALLPALLPRSMVTNAIVVTSMTNQLTRTFGPTAAGFFIALRGGDPSLAYGINLALFAGGWLAVMGLQQVAVETPPHQSSMVSLIREGLQFVRESSVILSLLILDFVVNVLTAYEALTPVFATEVLHAGPVGFGLLSSAPSVGAFVGSLCVLLIGYVERKGQVILVAAALYGLAVVGFAFSSIFWLTLLFAALLGAMDVLVVTLRNAAILLLTPDGLRGRVESIRTLFVQGGPTLGGLQAGALASVFGAPLVLGLEACLVLLVVLAVNFKEPQIRRVRVG